MLESRFLDTIASLGFRHVLEDGISILRSEERFGPKRRGFVLKDLAELFRQAADGSAVTGEPDQFLRTANATAFKSYKYIMRYLPKADTEGVASRLSRAARALKELAEGQEISPRRKRTAETLIMDLLNGMRATGRIRVPERSTSFAWKF